MPYTQFIGFINQSNVPPGSYDTLNRWKVFSELNENSNMLEIASTTGFSSRELHLMSGARGVGVDISQDSIDTANTNIKLVSNTSPIKYYCMDAYNLDLQDKFSHVILGSCLGFFEKPRLLLDNITKYLEDESYVLASPFYAIKKVPNDLVVKGKSVFGINPTTKGYKDVMSVYEKYEVIYESRHLPYQETEQELKKYCTDTINRFAKVNNVSDKIIDDSYKRLYEIKHTSNILRPFQGYNVNVFRYRKNIYPNRFTELF